MNDRHHDLANFTWSIADLLSALTARRSMSA
jgi:hypothetical protein